MKISFLAAVFLFFNLSLLAVAAPCKIEFALNCSKAELPIPYFQTSQSTGWERAVVPVEYDPETESETSNPFQTIQSQVEQYLPAYNVIPCFRYFPSQISMKNSGSCTNPKVDVFKKAKINAFSKEAAKLVEKWNSKNALPRYFSTNPINNFEIVAFERPDCFDGVVPRNTQKCERVIKAQFAKLFYKAQLDYKLCELLPEICNSIRNSIGKTIVELYASGIDIFQGAEVLFLREPNTWDERNRWFWHLTHSFAAEPELEVGESRWVVNQGTTLYAEYQITRNANRFYDIGLNIAFSPAAKDGISDFENIWKQRVRERVANCYQEASHYLIGPNNEHIRLKLLPEAKEHRVVVNMHNSVDRLDSRNGDLSAACPEILHETMHLLGLVDSYLETEIGVSIKNGKPVTVNTSADFPAYDMRTVSRYASLMSSHGEAFSRISDLENYSPKKVSVCVCRAGDHQESCIKNLATWDPEFLNCPSNAVEKEMYTTDITDDYFSRRGFVEPKNQNWVGRIFEMKNPYLLYPAEFNAILYPNDLLKNWQYYYCTEDRAYTTSVKNHGSGRLSPESRESQCKSNQTGWLYGVPEDRLSWLVTN